MSVQFYVAGEHTNAAEQLCSCLRDGDADPSCATCRGSGFTDVEPNYLDFSTSNAADLLRWLGYELDPEDGDVSGFLAPGDLRARCERRMRETPENFAEDLPKASWTGRGRDPMGLPGARVITCGRRAGYLRERTAELLALAVRAGDRFVEYS
jgi:hypothetical protein